MNISALFSTDERIMILREVIYQTEPINISKVSRKLSLSKGLMSKYFKILLEEGILNKKNGDYTVDNSVATKAVRILLNLNIFHTDFFSDRPFIISAGLYGSTVKGANIEGSDIDLWILTEETSQDTLAKLSNDLRNTFGEVRPLYLTVEKLEQLRKTEATFYHSLVFGSLTLYGDDIETF